jgi:hypothetical protein
MNNPYGARAIAAEASSMIRFSGLRDEAIERGHVMEQGWHDAAPAAWLARCSECEGFLVIDFAESLDGYGLAYDDSGECPGAPPKVSAVQRDPYFEEAAVFPPNHSEVGTRDDKKTPWIATWNWDYSEGNK